MSDFFSALELELRAAGERRPRRKIRPGQAFGIAAAAALVTAAVVLAAVFLGGSDTKPERLAIGPQPDPVGTVIRKGEGRIIERLERSIVVANGRAPIGGPWQMEAHFTGGGLACENLFFVHPPAWLTPAVIECQTFAETPGFTRHQFPLPPRGHRLSKKILPTQVLVFGRTPERAVYVRVTAPNGFRKTVRVHGGPRRYPGNYYLVALPVGVGSGARINWLDNNGKAGSVGLKLIEPVTRQYRR